MDEGYVRGGLREVRTVAARNRVLIVSYALTVACAVAAPFVDVAMERRIAPLRAELDRYEAELAALLDRPPAELPTQQLLEHVQGVVALHREQLEAIDAIHARRDWPLEAPLTEQPGLAFFATAYEQARRSVVADHAALLGERPPPCLEPVSVDRSTDRERLTKRLRVAAVVLDACAAAGAERVVRFEQAEPVPSPDSGSTARAVEHPTTVTVEMRLPRLGDLIGGLLRADVPMRVAAIRIDKTELDAVSLYGALDDEARELLARRPLRWAPNADRARKWYHDLCYELEIPKPEWDESLASVWLPEPPVRVTIEVRALDF